VFKFGRSCNLSTRIRQYPKGSNIEFLMSCINSKVCETEILKLLKLKFKQATLYGSEYFEGDKKAMIAVIYNYLINYDVKSDGGGVSGGEGGSSVVGGSGVSGSSVVGGSGVVGGRSSVSSVGGGSGVIGGSSVVGGGRIVNNVHNTTCPKCNIKFKYPSMLKSHLRKSFHCLTSEEDIKTHFNPIINIIKCNKCLKTFSQKSSLYRHQRNFKCI
jgi:hypothetical protein